MNKLIILIIFISATHLFGQLTGFLSGQVVDSLSLTPLRDVEIMVEGTQKGASTDKNGYFNLALVRGNYVLSIRMVGFKTLKSMVEIRQDSITHRTFVLSPRPYTMAPLTVTDHEIKYSVLDVDISPKLIEEFPALGESDVFHVVRALPAVTSAFDYGSQIYIRGSRFDQTLVTFNGLPIYNPYHMGGLFGVFDADATDKVAFSPDGNFIEQSERLSGRVNIIPKDGSDRQTKISLGLLSSKAQHGDTITNVSFFVSARRTYMDFLSRLDDTPGYGFYDFSVNLKYRLGNAHTLNLFSFYSRDFFQDIYDIKEVTKANNEDPYWGNNVSGIRWNWARDGNIFIEATLGHSGSLARTRADQVDVRNSYNEYLAGGKLLLSFKNHVFKTGLDFKSIRYAYRWNIGAFTSLENYIGPPQFVFFDNAPSVFQYLNNSLRTSLFIHDDINLLERFTLGAGVRLSWDNLTGGVYLLPSFKIAYQHSSKLSFSAALSSHIQYDYTLKRIKRGFFFAPFSIYFPTNKKQPPLQGSNLTFGVDFDSGYWGNVNAELYYKRMRNVPAVDLYTGRIETLKNDAYGFELLYRKNMDFLSMLASYAYSRSIIIDGQKSYLSGFDRSHALKLFTSYELGHNWQLSAYYTYQSGLPYSPLSGRFIGAGSTERDGVYISTIADPRTFIGSEGPVDLGRNSMRFPPYRRFDFGVQKKWYWAKRVFAVKLQALNIFNESNPAFIEANFDISNEEPETKNNLPFLPSVEFSFQF